jgi:hypothetical protein
MEQNDPRVTEVLLEHQLQRPELRRMHDADGVGERDVAAGIRIEENDPVALPRPRGFDQRKDRVPHLRHLPASAQRAALRQRAQPFDAPAVAAVSLDARHEWAHDKVMILDGAIVITGSYNWTATAEKDNGENLLVIQDPRLAGLYAENWRRHADHSTPYRRTASWWIHIRVVWASLTRRRPKRLASDNGEEG